MIQNNIPAEYKIEGMEEILQGFTDRGQMVYWNNKGPYIKNNDISINVSTSFLYPHVFKEYKETL